MKTVDCRGLACPQPVMETKKALDTSETKEVVVLVDNPPPGRMFPVLRPVRDIRSA
jgi:TusA-related sulfurtransferase